MPMNVVSVNVGLPREIFHQGRMIRSGIFKTAGAATSATGCNPRQDEN
jgi:hypothetical protein